jgi:hypothetical protein
MIEARLLRIASRGGIKVKYLLLATALFVAVLVAASSSFEGYTAQVEAIHVRPPKGLLYYEQVTGAKPFYARSDGTVIEVFAEDPDAVAKVFGAKLVGNSTTYVGRALAHLYPDFGRIEGDISTSFLIITSDPPPSEEGLHLFYFNDSPKGRPAAAAPSSSYIVESIHHQGRALITTLSYVFCILIAVLSLVQGAVISHHSRKVLQVFSLLGAPKGRTYLALAIFSLILGGAITALGFAIGFALPSLLSSLLSSFLKVPHVRPYFGGLTSLSLLYSFLSSSIPMAFGLTLGYRRASERGKEKVNTDLPFFLRVLSSRAVFALSVSLLVALSAAAISFGATYGAWNSMKNTLWGGENMITQRGSRTLFSSRVPASLAESLNHVEGVKANPYVITFAMAKGEQVIVRGAKDLSHLKLVSGRLPASDGLWALVGERLAERLAIKVGEIIPVGSSFKEEIALLSVVGIYRTGSPLDDELMVSLSMARDIGNMPAETVSFIELKGGHGIGRLITSMFNLNVRLGNLSGGVEVLDSLGRIVGFEPLKEGIASFSLPFGYYHIKYVEAYYTSDLAEVLLDRNMTLNPYPEKGEVTLKVFASASSNVTLEGKFYGRWEDGYWSFKVAKGFYVLRLNESSYPLPLYGDTAFGLETKSPYPLELSVVWADGRGAMDSLILVKDETGKVISSQVAKGSKVSLFLPEGTYEIEAYNPPFTGRISVKVPIDSKATVRIPAVKDASRVPPTLYEKLRLGFEVSSQSVIGITVNLLGVMFLIALALPALAVLAINRYLFSSASERLRVLYLLGAGKGFLFRRLFLPILILSLLLALTSYLLSVGLLFPYFEGLNLLGHEFLYSGPLLLLYLSLLYLLSFSYSFLRTHEGG